MHLNDVLGTPMTKELYLSSSDLSQLDFLPVLCTAEKCLLVINDNNKLLGTLTDGDLRRSILAGSKNSDKIESRQILRLLGRGFYALFIFVINR